MAFLLRAETGTERKEARFGRALSHCCKYHRSLRIIPIVSIHDLSVVLIHSTRASISCHKLDLSTSRLACEDVACCSMHRRVENSLRMMNQKSEIFAQCMIRLFSNE